MTFEAIRMNVSWFGLSMDNRSGNVLLRCYVGKAFCVLAGTALLAAQQADVEASVADAMLREMAVFTVLPEYPAKSLHNHVEGPAVVEMKITPHGSVASVNVLDAPDSEIRASVEGALKQWRFRALTVRGKAVTVSGRLIFYFRIRGSKGVVIDADAERLRMVRERVKHGPGK